MNTDAAPLSSPLARSGAPFWRRDQATPPRQGTRALPTGAPWCLWGKVFLFTGVLDTLDRPLAQQLVEHYGGRCAMSVVRKLTHVVVGADAGLSKLAKLDRRSDVVRLDESGLCDLIRESPAGDPSARDMAAFAKRRRTVGVPVCPVTGVPLAGLVDPLPPGRTATLLRASICRRDAPPSPSSSTAGRLTALDATLGHPPDDDAMRGPDGAASGFGHAALQGDATAPGIGAAASVGRLWVDRHAPRRSTQLLGNAEAVAALWKWLAGWAPAARGSGRHNAVLLSGPPGCGKTLAAHTVARECGYRPVELNASDVRSRSAVMDRVGHAVVRALSGARLVLIMDEVDGMSAGDRGGMRALCEIIDAARVPVICTCGTDGFRDVPRNARPLLSRCVRLLFERPPMGLLAERLAAVIEAERGPAEGDGERSARLRLASRIAAIHRGDVRRSINALHFSAARSDAGDEAHGQRDPSTGPYAAASELMSPGRRAGLTLDERLALVAVDPLLVPLLVHEHYLDCAARRAERVVIAPSSVHNELDESLCLSRAAESLSCADVLENLMHHCHAWSLGPVATALGPLASLQHVAPGGAGGAHRLRFPRWLGEHSRQGRRRRLLDGMARRMGGRWSGSLPGFAAGNENEEEDEARGDVRGAVAHAAADLVDGVVPLLAEHVWRPLSECGRAGVGQSLSVMQAYRLDRDDADSLLELSTWSRRPSLLERFPVAPPAKAALTRACKAVAQQHRHRAVLRDPCGEGDDDEDDHGGDDKQDDDDGDGCIRRRRSRHAAQREVAGKKSSSEAPAKKSKRRVTTAGAGATLASGVRASMEKPRAGSKPPALAIPAAKTDVATATGMIDMRASQPRGRKRPRAASREDASNRTGRPKRLRTGKDRTAPMATATPAPNPSGVPFYT